MALTELKLRIADWKKDREKLSAIRSQVFIKEQNVPEEMEWDEYDESAVHFLVFDKENVIASARLKSDGQIGRMAVLAEYRNRGIGTMLLLFILNTARDFEYKEVYLHAQVTAINFYQKQGFRCNTEIFYEANIPHRGMLLKIC